MSKEAARKFIEKVEQDAELQGMVRKGFETQNDQLDLVALARGRGFEFTKKEGLEVWDEIVGGEELSDFALELVSGGVPADCGDNLGTQT